MGNVGTETWMVTEGGQFDSGNPTIVETLDGGSDCPDGALREPFPASVTVLGKNGDDLNDNILVDSQRLPESGYFLRESLFPSQSGRVFIKVAPDDYEDVRLRLELGVGGTENCEGNEWNVSWQFTVVPITPDPMPTPLP